MIRLRPHLRLFVLGEQQLIESLLNERTAPADDALVDVLKVLEQGPAASSSEIAERLEARGAPWPRPEIHARLSVLSGLGLIDTRGECDDPAWVFDQLAAQQPAVPVIDQIELTNHCPMTCIMCPTGTGTMVRDKGFIDGDMFRRIVDEVVAAGSQIKPLTLHNLGESLLHPELDDFIAYATARGLKTELSANPGMLSLARYRRLEDAGLSRLVLDVDGLDAETLERIRGPAAKGDKAFAHLDAILDHRRSSPRAAPQIVLQMIEQPLNAGQLDAFVERYGHLGIEGVEAWPKPLDANTRCGGELQQIRKRIKRQLCRAPFKSVVILWDGTVIPCCHDANGELPLGSLSSATLAEIWRGPAAGQLRAALREGQVPADSPCARCAHRADRYELPDLERMEREPLAW
jgi:radical SAM protein with 4Fe4S-binding SPASM domain